MFYGHANKAQVLLLLISQEALLSILAMCDVSHSSTDLGHTIRNYFETSHAKGPQVGAGAKLKHQGDTQSSEDR